ncbi:MATE family efflux transporter [Paraburkholderia sp. BL6669N2]|uniref:MATE family efflux transporter n=1 Tax=Paraburkholderia sp. BL6669N2 TaxID=1938807 RepID=UPI000E236DFD|nr:MATE family efflux transporter [Paraburkholderia sp. BL6669N2]
MLRLAIPTIIVLAAQTLVGVVETYYVGFLGTASLVGVALVFPFSMLMTMMSNGGIGGGVASAIARSKGAGRHDDSDALVLHALILAIAFGLAFSAIAILAGPTIYSAFGGSAEAHQAALQYSKYVFAAAVPVWIVNLCSAALRGSGAVKVPAITTLVGSFLLVFLSPALIFGFGPVPRLGIAGAGVSVSLYYTIAAVVLVRHLLRGTSGLRLRRSKIEWRLFLDILRVGALASISTVQLNLMVIIVTASVGFFGTTALAGYGMAARLDYALIPILFGLGTSVLTMVGINSGAGNQARARRIAWTGVLTGSLFMEVVGALAAIFPHVWIGLFSSDSAVIEPGAAYLRIVGPFYGAVGATFILGFAAQGVGKPKWPTLAGTSRLLIAGGIGWVCVARFGTNMHVLFAITAAASVISVAICLTAALSGAIWKIGH